MTNNGLRDLQGYSQIPDFSKHCCRFQSNHNLSTIRASKNLDFSVLDDVHFLTNFSLNAILKKENFSHFIF